MNQLSSAWPAANRKSGAGDIAVPHVSPHSTAGWLTWPGPVKRCLDQLLELELNWDGRRSSRVSPETALFAFQLLTNTMPPEGRGPSIVPLGNGALQLEWHTIAADLEIEVCKPNVVSVWYEDHETADEQEFEVTTDFRRLTGLIWSVANA